jgi:choline kinase
VDELAQAHTVRACDIHGLSWCEVDEAEDLAHAQRVVVTWPDSDCEQTEANGTAARSAVS